MVYRPSREDAPLRHDGVCDSTGDLFVAVSRRSAIERRRDFEAGGRR